MNAVQIADLACFVRRHQGSLRDALTHCVTGHDYYLGQLPHTADSYRRILWHLASHAEDYT